MTRCLFCQSTVLALSLIPMIEERAEERQILSAWEMATYGATLHYLEKHVPLVVKSEYLPGVPSGEMVEGVLVQDVHHTSFQDESFDLITCNQVFEHVADDLRGFAECHRILRPGGALIFAIPLSDAPATEKVAELVDGDIVHLAPPEYHNSRVTGPGTALVFWRHSLRDIGERVASVGFDVEVRDVRVLPGLPDPAKVIVAVKPGAG